MGIFNEYVVYFYGRLKKPKKPHTILLANVKAKQIWNILKIDFKLVFVKIYSSGVSKY